MRADYNDIKKTYEDLLPILTEISKMIEQELEKIVGDEKHVDRIVCRCKSVDSFMKKTEKLEKNGSLKYDVPIKEIQDKMGARVVVYYKSDVAPINKIIEQYFRRIEEKNIVPDDVTKFGYEGFHVICKIPPTIFQSKQNILVGDFFELQIKTLYQHAWSQSNHGLGYKPGQELSDDETRLLAFIAAQSWGADRALLELSDEKIKIT